MSSVIDLIGEMRRLREEEIALKGLNANDPSRYRLYAPADDASIAAHERDKIPYPPSYREFLKVSNGWLGFWPDWSLVGIPSDENGDMYRDIGDTLNIIPDELDATEQAQLTEEEKEDPKRILATNHMI